MKILCVGCRGEIKQNDQKPVVTCAECWAKLPREIRSEYLVARDSLAQNRSRIFDRVKRKRGRLATAINDIAIALAYLKDPVTPTADGHAVVAAQQEVAR